MMTAENTYKLLAAILIVIVAAIRIWPKIKANNIFLAAPSNKGQSYIQAGPMSQPRVNPMHAMWAAILIGIVGFALSIYGSIVNSSENGLTQSGNNYGGMFVLGLFVSFAVFIHILITPKFTSSLLNLKFTLRLWFTTLFTAPLLAVLGLFAINIFPNLKLDNLVSLYYSFVVFSSGFGAIILAILIVSINYISKQYLKISEKRETILLLAECMMAMIMLFLSIKINLGFYWVVVWAPYAIIMGLAIRFFKLEELPFTETGDEPEDNI